MYHNSVIRNIKFYMLVIRLYGGFYGICIPRESPEGCKYSTIKTKCCLIIPNEYYYILQGFIQGIIQFITSLSLTKSRRIIHVVVQIILIMETIQALTNLPSQTKLTIQ